MNNYKQHILSLLKRLLFLILLFQVTRLIFFLFNYSNFNSFGFWNTVKAFVWGTRFDLWVIFIFNALFVIMHLVPGNYKNIRGYQSFLKWYFVLVNSLIIIPNFIDVEYFKFTNKRSTADLLSLITTGDDTLILIPQFFKDFWYIILIYICLVFLIYKWSKKQFKVGFSDERIKKSHFFSQLFICFFAIGLMFLVVRGSSLRPVNMMSAARFASPGEVPLVLNTTFTIIKTWSKDNLIERNYLKKEQEEKYFSPVYLIKGHGNEKNKNVVIIILESFSKEYIGFFNKECKGFTPFLDSLFENSLVFENSFANGKKSLESLPSILAGIPSLSETPYILSKYSSDQVNGLPGILQSHGYNTSFYHGGTNGTMGFDVFSYMAGCKQYFGRNEYPVASDYDGHWGIWDEPYLKYFADQLKKTREPFFSVVYTLSSHHPYKVPEKYKKNLPTGKYEIMQSIAYTDLSLRKFFSEARKSPWFNNTLFVITADHTFWAIDDYYNNRIGMYSVPIVFYSASDSTLRGSYSTIIQHSDITPTILDYLSIKDTILCFGRSAFDTSTVHFSVNYISGNYQLVKNNYLLLFDGEKSVSLFDFKKDRLLSDNIMDSFKTITLDMENMLKSIIQSYNNRMIHNKLTTK